MPKERPEHLALVLQTFDAAIASLISTREILQALLEGIPEWKSNTCTHPNRQDVVGFGGIQGWTCPDCLASSNDDD